MSGDLIMVKTVDQIPVFIPYFILIGNRGLLDTKIEGVVHSNVLAVDRQHFPALEDVAELWLVFDHQEIDYDACEKEDSYYAG